MWRQISFFLIKQIAIDYRDLNQHTFLSRYYILCGSFKGVNVCKYMYVYVCVYRCVCIYTYMYVIMCLYLCMHAYMVQ